jgi:hypothetical protein
MYITIIWIAVYTLAELFVLVMLLILFVALFVERLIYAKVEYLTELLMHIIATQVAILRVIVREGAANDYG